MDGSYVSVHRDFVGLCKYKWLKKEDRGKIKNLWGVFKKLLSDMSNDSKVTNGGYHEYDRIELTQFLFAISILDVR